MLYHTVKCRKYLIRYQLENIRKYIMTIYEIKTIVNVALIAVPTIFFLVQAYKVYSVVKG